VISGPRVGRVSGSLSYARAGLTNANDAPSAAARSPAARAGRPDTDRRDAAGMVIVRAEYSH